jgi:hypothetical protein
VSTTPVANSPPVSLILNNIRLLTNLPPESLTPVSSIGEKFTTSAVDTGVKFATGVVDIDSIFGTGGVDNGGVHLDLRKSLRIFEKIEMTLTLFSEPWGTMSHEKNPKQKIPCQCPLIVKSNISICDKNRLI